MCLEFGLVLVFKGASNAVEEQEDLQMCSSKNKNNKNSWLFLKDHNLVYATQIMHLSVSVKKYVFFY